MLHQARNLKNSETAEVIGTISFTKRELDILACLLSGKSAKSIGPLLSIAPRTVETHVQKIMAKLNCNSKEHIIGFIEHSGHFGALKQRYIELLKEKDPNINIEWMDCLPKNNKFHVYGYLAISMIILGSLIMCGPTWIKMNNVCSVGPIRSNLLIPAPSHLLNRPQLLKKIEAKFKQQSGIQTVALVGIGGCGKTIVARQYAKTQNLPMIWELNAETPEALLSTFEDLAYELSKTAEEKQTLEGIKKIEQREERTKKLLSFIKPKFKAKDRWLLVFDNVDQFNTIKPFFPADIKAWGGGKVLITTRNNHIKDNVYVNFDHIICLQDLNAEEKQMLFEKIVANNKAQSTQKKETKAFLNLIPPFPLDVSVAAHYIKNTQISYQEYLNCISTFNHILDHQQSHMLQDITDHVKTRYGIITHTIQTLIKINPEFIEPLLLISLIQPNHIPKELLNQLKSKEIIDQFIHEMGKHSLLTIEKTEDQILLSIHHSTQEIMRQYLIQTLTTERKDICMSHVIEALEKYSDTLLLKSDVPGMRTLLNKLVVFEKHKPLLSPLNQALLDTHIGRLAFRVGYECSKSYTEKGLAGLEKHFGNQHHHSIAHALSYLGIEEKLCGNYKKSFKLLEKSVELYRNFYPYLKEKYAYALMLLGHVCNSSGKFEEAKSLLQQSSEICQSCDDTMGLIRARGYLADLYLVSGDYQQALSMYEQNLIVLKKKLSKSHNQIVWGTVRLGFAYKGLGQYIKAKHVLQAAIKLYKTLLPDNFMDRIAALIALADVERLLGFYDKADLLMQESLDLNTRYCEKNSSDTVFLENHLSHLLLDKGLYDKVKDLLDHALQFFKEKNISHLAKIGYVKFGLARTYMLLGQYKKAEEFFTSSLEIYRNHYGPHHTDSALILCEFGHFFILKGEYLKAEDLLNQALITLKKNNHVGHYKCLEYLGDLYGQKSKNLQKQDQISCQKQSKIYFQQALTVIQAYFPADSIHISRLQQKIKTSIA